MRLENVPYLFLAILPLIFVYMLIKSLINKKRETTRRRLNSASYITDTIDTKEELEDVEKERIRENDYGVSVVQVVPNSQFYDDIDQIINYITYANPVDKEYLLVALNNTKAKGYKLMKVEETENS